MYIHISVQNLKSLFLIEYQFSWIYIGQCREKGPHALGMKPRRQTTYYIGQHSRI